MARSYGYKITVIRSYTFKRQSNLFKDYVIKYYDIKSKSSGAKKAIAFRLRSKNH
jgi:hypothetical protein